MQRANKPGPVHCPRCGRSLEASGVVTTDGRSFPVYQCDDCVVNAATDGGEPIPAALTFCVDENGKAFDPATSAGALPPAA